MRLLICTTVFHPQVGGVETIVHLLAREAARLGHKVVVATETQGAVGSTPYHTVRKPSKERLYSLYRQADGIILMGATLRLGWPLFILSRRAVISHQGFTPLKSGLSKANGVLRRRLLDRVINVACSNEVAEAIGGHCYAIGNPYDERVFCRCENLPRDLDVAFVGRLVPEKGPDLLLEALRILADRGRPLSATVIGDGPMRNPLAQQIDRSGLASHVKMVGQLQGESLAQLLNRHRILAVPSTWREPFGIVALEGAACGCFVIGSDEGGLPGAIGPCGTTFSLGDPVDLADRLSHVERTTATEIQGELVTRHLNAHQSSQYTLKLLSLLGTTSSSRR